MSWLYTAVAVSLAGTGMEMAGQEQSADAMEAASNKFQGQQSALEKRAGTVFQNSAQKESLPATQQTLSAGTGQRLQLTDALKQAAGGTGMALPANAPSDDTQSGPMSRAQSNAATAGNMVQGEANQATAAEGSLGDWSTQQQINAMDANNQLMPIQTESRQNISLFPTELTAASHSGDQLSGWGSLLQAVGAIGGLSAAVSGAGAAAGSAAGSVANAPGTAAEEAAAMPATTQFASDAAAGLGESADWMTNGAVLAAAADPLGSAALPVATAATQVPNIGQMASFGAGFGPVAAQAGNPLSNSLNFWSQLY